MVESWSERSTETLKARQVWGISWPLAVASRGGSGGKLSIQDFAHEGTCHGATKQKGSVCFQAKVYTVNAAEIARPGD